VFQFREGFADFGTAWHKSELLPLTVQRRHTWGTALSQGKQFQSFKRSLIVFGMALNYSL